MRRKNRTVSLALMAWLLVVAATSVAAEMPVTLRIEEMDAYVGKPLFVRLVNEETQIEIARWNVPAIREEPMEMELIGIQPEVSYRVDLFVDLNENGRYDAPPVDAAWRIALSAPEPGDVVVFAPTEAFLDIRWAPHVDGVIEEGEYAHALNDPQTGMTLFWSNDDLVLHVGLISPGTGWLAVGFSPQRRMLGANIIIAAMVDGALQIEEHHGNSQTSHRRDDEEHILQSAGTRTEEGTVLEFSILLDSGDPQDALLEPGSEVLVILAYHSTRTDFRVGHTRRSAVTIALD